MQIEGIGSSMTVGSSIGTRVGKANTSDNTQKLDPSPLPIQRKTKQEPEQKFVEEKHFTEEDTIKIIEDANKNFVTFDRRFEFSIHEATKQIMVKVIDANTDEIIRELPPEKVLDMVAAMWEVAGVIVDRKI